MLDDSASPTPSSAAVTTCDQLATGALEGVLAPWGLAVVRVPEGQPIAGSWFGEPEAGIRGQQVFVRGDTPVHSALHEACHLILATVEGRGPVDADAGGDYDEENAVCLLQILLAEGLPGVGSERLMADMDTWGYSFREGSTGAWFEGDAEDARQWLRERGLLDEDGRPVARRVFDTPEPLRPGSSNDGD
ncbi:MAG: hypothetical protein AAF481_19420 [Acidobacteriota bacterium]